MGLFGENAFDDYIVINRLHMQVLGETRGSLGPRDFNAMRSAMARPFRTAFGVEMYPDVYEKAAALIDSIVNRVVFRDGNKRTAMAAAVLFLALHDIVVTFRRDEYENFMLRVVFERPSVYEISDWLKQHSNTKRLAAPSPSIV